MVIGGSPAGHRSNTALSNLPYHLILTVIQVAVMAAAAARMLQRRPAYALAIYVAISVMAPVNSLLGVG